MSRTRAATILGGILLTLAGVSVATHAQGGGAAPPQRVAVEVARTRVMTPSDAERALTRRTPALERCPSTRGFTSPFRLAISPRGRVVALSREPVAEDETPRIRRIARCVERVLRATRFPAGDAQATVWLQVRDARLAATNEPPGPFEDERAEATSELLDPFAETPSRAPSRMDGELMIPAVFEEPRRRSRRRARPRRTPTPSMHGDLLVPALFETPPRHARTARRGGSTTRTSHMDGDLMVPDIFR